MFDFLSRKIIFETTDIDKKNHLQKVFNENKIDYIIRKKDTYHRNAFDTMKMGEMMIKSKYVYVFWVKKNHYDLAMSLIKY